MLANLKAKVWMDDLTMTRLCCFLTHRDSSLTPYFFLQLSPLNRLKWQKAASPHQLCLAGYFLPSILCNICPRFQHFKVMSTAAFCLQYLTSFFEKTQHTLWVMSWFFWDLMIIIILYVLLLALISPSANLRKVLESPTRDIIPITFILPCIKSQSWSWPWSPSSSSSKKKKYCKFASGQKVTSDTLHREKEEMNSARDKFVSQKRHLLSHWREMGGWGAWDCHATSLHTSLLLVCNMTNCKINF